MHPFTWFLILYTGSVLIGVAMLWWWFDRRDKKQFETIRRSKAFHCVRCGTVYGARDPDLAQGVPCPECQYKNFELSF